MSKEMNEHSAKFIGKKIALLTALELVLAFSGLGYLISDASEMARTDQVFVGIFMIAILGILGDFLFQKALFKVAPWSKK